MQTLWSVIIIISAIAVTVAVTVQEGKDRADSTFLSPEPIWGKNKGIGKDFTLKRITIISMLVFAASTLALLINN